MSIKSENVIKKYKIVDFSIDNDEDTNLKDNNNNLIFSSGTPQLDNGKNQWAALYNPKNSKSTIYIDSTCVVNFSSTPIVQSIFLNPKINYEGFQYMYGVSNSLEYGINSNGVVLFYQGNDNKLFPNEANLLRVLPPFYTDNSQKQGNIIIPPGKSILILVNSIDNYKISCAISYSWWEEWI